MKYTYILLSFLVVSLLSAVAVQAEEKGVQGGYHLSIGDNLNVTVFDEEDLSGEFEIDDLGNISLPLIGDVNVADQTLSMAEKLIKAKFKDGYLVSPRVTLAVLDFRPFYILGEVKNPGGYPYANGLTVINAVALAGGYTYRAKESRPIILRGKEGDKIKIRASETTLVLPGDVVKIDERFF